MSRVHPWWRLLPWLLLPFVAACFSGFNSKELPQQSYVLRLDAATPSGAAALTRGPVARAAASLEVLLPAAGAGLSGDGIAVVRSGERLDYYNAARWAAPAPALLQTLVVERLRRDGRFALVEPESGPFEAAYLLSLELTHFEAYYEVDGPPTVHVELVCSLGQRSGRRVLESFTVSGAATASADRMQAVVAAFDQATNAALAQLGAQLRLPSATPTSGAQ